MASSIQYRGRWRTIRAAPIEAPGSRRGRSSAGGEVPEHRFDTTRATCRLLRRIRARPDRRDWRETRQAPPPTNRSNTVLFADQLELKRMACPPHPYRRSSSSEHRRARLAGYASPCRHPDVATAPTETIFFHSPERFDSQGSRWSHRSVPGSSGEPISAKNARIHDLAAPPPTGGRLASRRSFPTHSCSPYCGTQWTVPNPRTAHFISRGRTAPLNVNLLELVRRERHRNEDPL